MSSSSLVSTSLSTSVTGTTVTSASSVASSSSPTVPTPTGPTIVPSAGLYNYMGCYTEGMNTRALGDASYPSDSNSIAQCAASCSAYKYFGAEYGRECWCGNTFGAGSVLTSNSDCSMTCAGYSTEYCGAGNRLTVYIKNGTSAGLSSSSVSSSQHSSVASSLTSITSSLRSSTSSSLAPSQTLAISQKVGSSPVSSSLVSSSL